MKDKRNLDIKSKVRTLKEISNYFPEEENEEEEEEKIKSKKKKGGGGEMDL